MKPTKSSQLAPEPKVPVKDKEDREKSQNEKMDGEFCCCSTSDYLMVVAVLNIWNLLRFIPLALGLWIEPKDVMIRKCTYWIWFVTTIMGFFMVGAVASGAPDAAAFMFIGWVHDIVILFALDKWQKELR